MLLEQYAEGHGRKVLYSDEQLFSIEKSFNGIVTGYMSIVTREHLQLLRR